jgi:hypothetical protein
MIWGYDEFFILGYNAMQFAESQKKVWETCLFHLHGLRGTPSKKLRLQADKIKSDI